MKKPIAIVGAGFSGAVIARKLAEQGFKCFVFEKRTHIGGNCHTYKDPSTGVLIHQYGPHIFHTGRQDVWDWVNNFGTFIPYTHKVKAHTKKGIFSLPINLHTLNQFFNRKLSPEEAKAFLKKITTPHSDISTFENYALHIFGKELYENFYKDYTLKQWGVCPSELPSSIIKRLPLRFTYDENYFSDPYQAIPKQGYTEIIKTMLDNKNIKILLSADFDPKDISHFRHIFYSGPIDRFFNFQLGPLEYRSLRFKRIEVEGDYQGTSVMNYCQKEVPYTRITEFKHFTPWSEHQMSVCFKEYSYQAQQGDELFYPIGLEKNNKLLLKYQTLASQLKNMTFIGRLGTYRYLNMDQCIGEALDIANAFIEQNILIQRKPLSPLRNPLWKKQKKSLPIVH